MIILAPAQSTPTTAPPQTKPIAIIDRFDVKLVEAVGQSDIQPVPLWATIHEVVNGEHPVDRTHRRRLVGQVLCRTRLLLRRGFLLRDGKNRVRLSEQSPAPPPSSPTSPPTAKPVKNWPPAPDPTVGDWGGTSTAGSAWSSFRFSDAWP